MLRVTPKLSYGINENWEGTLYCLNLDRALRSHAQQAATAEVDTKVVYRATPENDGNVRLGFENYGFLGPLRAQQGPNNRTSSTFLVTDFSFRRWDFNVGLGKASGAIADKWLLKALIGMPLD